MSIKTCPQCKIAKELAQFAVNKSKRDGLQNQCKDCRSTYNKSHYKKDKEKYKARSKKSRDTIKQDQIRKLLDYLEKHPCIDCGETDPVVLDFDHIDRTTKKFDVGTALWNRKSWEVIIEEIHKCQVLCANCHRRKTAKEFNWYKLRGTKG